MSQISDDIMAFLNTTTNWKTGIIIQRALPSDSLLVLSPALSLYQPPSVFLSHTQPSRPAL